jgi:hypothetical protein
LNEQTFPVSASSGGVTFIDAVRGCSGLTGDAKKLNNAGRRDFNTPTIEELLATCSSLAEGGNLVLVLLGFGFGAAASLSL